LQHKPIPWTAASQSQFCWATFRQGWGEK